MLNEKTDVTEITRKPKRRHPLLLLYIASIILCGLDYKASSSGQGFIVQAPIWGFYFLSFSMAILPLFSAEYGIRELRYFVLICLSFVVFSSIVGFWAGQDSWAIFTNGISFSVYVTATIFTVVVLKLCRDRAAMLNNIKNACLAFMILHFLMAYVTGGGIDLATSRYSYLSGATIPASAILAIGAVFYFGKKEFLIAATNLAIILISVTRTELAIIAGQIASVFFASPLLVFRPSVLKKGVCVILLATSVIGVDIAAGTGLTQRWITRMSTRETNRYGVDPTALTRFAESHYMYQRFTSSFEHFLLGNGLAAQTKLTGPSAKLAATIVGMGSVTSVRSFGFGHNNHMGILFVGGLFFGVPLLLLNFVNGLQAFNLMRKLFKQRGLYEKDFIYIGIWGALIVTGMLTEGFLSGVFSERASCLWYGIGTGMLYWARGESKQLKTMPPHSRFPAATMI